MQIERSIVLPCSAERCFSEVQTPRLLLYVARPVLRFVPLESTSFPERWEQREYVVAVRLLGVVPIGKQLVNISGRDRSSEKGRFYVELRDNGRGTLMSKWDHLITIEARPEGCRYTDRVEIQAGFLTPFVWLFAWFFYRHRQNRWRRLVANNFAYGHQP
jgi:hypothetical protein